MLPLTTLHSSSFADMVSSYRCLSSGEGGLVWACRGVKAGSEVERSRLESTSSGLEAVLCEGEVGLGTTG